MPAKRTPSPRLSEADIRALTKSIETVRGWDAFHRQWVDGKLADGEPWQEVGECCAVAAQERALRLKPWQIAPLSIHNIEASLEAPEDEHRGHRRAAQLLAKMLALGVSRYTPNPIAAIELAEGT
jgi:hypothetical protein